MRTYTHGVIGYLLYARRSSQERRLAAAGGVLPDVLLAVGYVFHVAEPHVGLQMVAGAHALLHHSPLHSVTVAMHSFLVVGWLTAFAWLFIPSLLPLGLGMLSHGVVDLLTHGSAAYNHLYPLPIRPWSSPVSYTTPVFTVVEHLGVLAFAVWVLRRRRLSPGSPPTSPGRAAASRHSPGSDRERG